MGIGMPKPVTPGRVQSAFWTLPKSRSTSLEHTIKPGGESRKASARFNNKKSKGVITSSRKDEFTADQAYKTRHFLVLTFPHRLWRGERRLSPPEWIITILELARISGDTEANPARAERCSHAATIALNVAPPLVSSTIICTYTFPHELN